MHSLSRSNKDIEPTGTGNQTSAIGQLLCLAKADDILGYRETKGN